MSFNPAEYATVAERLVEFWKDCPRGRIMTFMEVDDGTRVLMRGELYADIGDPVPTTTGWAEEVRGSSMVNKTSAVENCETSLCGRLLANYMYQGSKNRASLEEIVKVYRQGGELSASGPSTSTNSDAPVEPFELHHMSRKTPARTQTIGSSGEPPTMKQLGMLRAKNWEGAVPATKREASELIDRLMHNG
ncbi:hypothetical protein UFOVP1511_12 [uncultured Caudovirales phage]|uniref:Uncharacterized protein n=1 Tax=uncultured Caudovirales phage TaxID=2100421 RepID=A0A6J7X9Q0_9CAUD|nr:hypothetical protein UFOVP871_12 [uncultured Caudovirales phage]CAB4194955.1 hypothetical protein UFOVP1280_12 [uncultured Caudovirales phage]CAB4223199.1 hypothetical protein UFOVP1663_12 [uncultured Caudovirales phage]CAB5226698.1 hypothetical protein UFOVP1511_12 [uncultured Caudovirales phage]